MPAPSHTGRLLHDARIGTHGDAKHAHFAKLYQVPASGRCQRSRPLRVTHFQFTPARASVLLVPNVASYVERGGRHRGKQGILCQCWRLLPKKRRWPRSAWGKLRYVRNHYFSVLTPQLLSSFVATRLCLRSAHSTCSARAVQFSAASSKSAFRDGSIICAARCRA